MCWSHGLVKSKGDARRQSQQGAGTIMALRRGLRITGAERKQSGDTFGRKGGAELDLRRSSSKAAR